MCEHQFEFEWDLSKASANLRKHGVSFKLARFVSSTTRKLITLADIEHSELEERWFSVGTSGSGVMLSVVYLWSDVDSTRTKIRLISARKATRTEIRYYQEGV